MAEQDHRAEVGDPAIGDNARPGRPFATNRHIVHLYDMPATRPETVCGLTKNVPGLSLTILRCVGVAAAPAALIAACNAAVKAAAFPVPTSDGFTE